jgi:DNA-binding protein H-NS
MNTKSDNKMPLSIRISPSLKAEIAKQAKLDDRSLSKWVEIAIVERLARLKENREPAGRGR